MKRIHYLLVWAFVCLAHIAFAQINTADAGAELNKRGITEEELRARLAEKGIDLNTVDPGRLSEVQGVIEETVRELEAEKAQELKKQEILNAEKRKQMEVEKTATVKADSLAKEKSKNALEEQADQVAKESAEKIKKAVESGKPIEEAISEELLAQQNQLPPSTIYGQHIFRNKNIKLFNQSQDIRPSDDYVLGVGDKINISIWGIASYSGNFEINKDGYIAPERIPRIYVKGFTYAKVKELLRSRFAQYYPFRREEFDVSIVYSRTITVNIYGEAMNTGGFTLPATNTAFNALVASGGPTDIGSVRKIKLIRAGANAKTLDIYEFMLNPAQQADFFLENNDILHIPVVEKVVSISGAVKRPFKYELLENENLKKLIQYAGGLTENAYRSTVQIKRYQNDKEVIVTANLADVMNNNKDVPLFAGDSIYLVNIPKPFTNFVEVSGAVNISDRFELTNGMKLSDILQKAILADDARKDIAFLARSNADNTLRYQKIDLAQVLSSPSGAANITLQPRDKVIILSQTKFAEKGSVNIQGAVRDTGNVIVDAANNISLAEILTLSGGLRQDAADFGYIKRYDPKLSRIVNYIRFNPIEALKEGASPIVVEPNDSIFVYSTKQFSEIATVSVSGYVRSPGNFVYDESLSLKDVITMSGGLKLEAATNRIDVFRVELKDSQPTRTVAATVSVGRDLSTISEQDNLPLFPFDQIVVRAVPEFELQQNISLLGEIKYPGEYALIDDNEKLMSVIARAGGLTGEAFPEGINIFRTDNQIGYIAVDFQEAMRNSNAAANLILKKGDIIEIPKRKDLVTIQGETYLSTLYVDRIARSGRISVPFVGAKSAKWYVDEYAAGIGENGTRKSITVQYPSGKVKRTQNYLLFRRYPTVAPGSIVTVGRKPVELKTPEQKEKEKVDWSRVLADSIAQATAILSLILLIQRVN